MRHTLIVIAGLLFTLIASHALANPAYLRSNQRKSQQAIATAAAQTGVASNLQASLVSQRATFNQRMTSRDYRQRQAAKREYSSYLGRLQRALLTAQNAHGPAVYWTRKYARSLQSIRRTAPQAPAVYAQARNLENAQRQLKSTREAIERERRAVNRRN